MTPPTAPVDLRAERLRRGLSAAALAAEIEVKEDVILYAERHRRRPHPENARKIAAYFGLDLLVQWPLTGADTSQEAAA